MSKRIKIFLAILLLPLVFMAFINEVPTVPVKSKNYSKRNCTRYCHDVTCLHYKASFKTDPTIYKKNNKAIFDWYLTSLHANKLGLNYRNINLLVFVVGYPFLASLLLWNLIRNIK